MGHPRKHLSQKRRQEQIPHALLRNDTARKKRIRDDTLEGLSKSVAAGHAERF